MKNIFLLPTEKPSRLFKFANQLHLDTIPKDYYKKYNIYITSDEEIKEGDWVVKISSLYKGGGNVQKYSFIDSQFEDITFKKIILTTDQDLIADGVQSIENEFLEWFVNNPSCEFIDVKKQYITPLGDVVDFCYDNERLNYKIIIPQEEPGSKIMKNIHVLPTEKPSRFSIKVTDGFQGFDFHRYNERKRNTWYRPQHIYITSDEEIKDEDYCVHTNQSSIIKICEGEGKLMKGHLYLKKIILTTDQDLIAEGVQAIDDDFLQWLVKNPSCENVEVRKYHSGILSDISEITSSLKIIIPKEESKQETLEEAADNWVEKPVIGTRRESFIAGAKRQAEKMYSEEDMREAFKANYIPFSATNIGDVEQDFQKWFEQFKKK